MQQENYTLLFGEWTRLLDSQDVQAAEAFYFAKILPAILPIVKKRSGNVPKYNGLISLLGFTPETIVLTSRLLKPKKLVSFTRLKQRSSLELQGNIQGFHQAKSKVKSFCMMTSILTIFIWH